MHTKKILAIILFSTLLSAGCDYVCDPNIINPVFIGFSPAQLDTLVLKWYKPNDNYHTLVDTLLVVNPAASANGLSAGVYSTMNDTTIVSFNVSTPLTSITPGYDFELYIPAIKRTIFISDIVGVPNKGNKHCGDLISSFEQDSQLISTPVYFGIGSSFTNGYRAYIHP